MMSVYEMTKDLPAFKSYSKRRINGKSKTMEQILADLRKKRMAEFRAFCKPRGLLSILKENEYTTGRVVRSRGDCEYANCLDCTPKLYQAIETLKLRKFGNDIISDSPDPDTVVCYSDEELISGHSEPIDEVA
jgi:hypothetical protein